MRGFPKHINNRRDVENLVQLYPTETKRFLDACIANRKVWQTTKELAAAKDGKTSATQRVIEAEDDSKTMKLLQQELVEDQQCKLFQLGLTVEAAEGLMDDEGGEHAYVQK